MADFIPQGDEEFFTWMQNFLAAAQQYRVEAGLTPEQLEALNDAMTAFGEGLAVADAKKRESLAATSRKDTLRDTAEDVVRPMVRRIKTSPGMTDTAFIAMGITDPDATPRSRRSPLPPDGLEAELEAPGRVHLDWDSGGNTAGVQYVIEMQNGDSGEFVLVDVVTRRSYTHTGAPLGARLIYRVLARRNGETSGPSNEATVRT
jgi:hypothetical protein